MPQFRHDRLASLVRFRCTSAYIAIATTTWYGGMRAGIVAIVLSALAVNYFFIPPIHKIQIASFKDVFRLILFAIVGLIISLLSANLQRSKRKIEQLNRSLAQESANRLQIALSAAQMGMWDWNLVKEEITWSPEHEQLFGLDSGTFDGKYATFDERLHPDDRSTQLECVDCHPSHSAVPSRFKASTIADVRVLTSNF